MRRGALDGLDGYLRRVSRDGPADAPSLSPLDLLEPPLDLSQIVWFLGHRAHPPRTPGKRAYSKQPFSARSVTAHPEST